MKKVLTIFSILLFGISSQAYVEEVSTAPYVDKFQPSSGVKIKESNIAARMENATRNAAYGDKNQKKQLVRKKTNKNSPVENTNVRSYKWF